MDHRHFDNLDDGKTNESSFRATNDEWRLSPSLMDANSFSFASFANQAPGYCTPAATGGTGTSYHSKAGDLHTPNLGFHLGTPLSLPHSEGRHNALSAFDMHSFQPNILEAHGFRMPDHFGLQETFAPGSFLHRDSAFETMDGSSVTTPAPHTVAGNAVSQQTKAGVLPSETVNLGLPEAASPPSNAYVVLFSDSTAIGLHGYPRFRYQVTLNAPTAMIKHADEIPVTYLNKGQAYTITVVDSLGVTTSPIPVRYRTVVRISFEDQQQRQRPAACWQLWKEGRGLAEAHQRGGRLQAVEYVDPNQGGDLQTKRARAELEKSSFDCFAVTWSPVQGAVSAEFSVAVRFNFLSTDFSHSKGVKGIPVRLCAKTEIISPGTPDSPPGPISEVCFCKVKLFRDHGAERKLSNDVAHIKKNIEKLKQQVNQVESGTKDLGKRKRSGSMAKSGSNRPAKVPKHKRTWSVSSEGSGGRPALEEDLYSKLATLQNMFSSTRPHSALYLKGYDDDDPDMYPVTLPGQLPSLTSGSSLDRRLSQDQKASEATSPTNSSVSPSSAHSASGPAQSVGQPDLANIGDGSHLQEEWETFTHFTNSGFQTHELQMAQPFPDPVLKVQRSQGMTNLPHWIDTMGVDPDYKAPPERTARPVACIYVLIKTPSNSANDDCYQAVYLMERTVGDLVAKLAMKSGIEPSRVGRTVQVNSKGLKIMVDDAVVGELPEGQDMTIEFVETRTETVVKQEQVSPMTATNLELRLHF
ncbi:MAG: hypothetical protein Q9219_000984 [cf. Caloplaca sp. 3 TL-2023]